MFCDRYHSFYHFGKPVGNYENKNSACDFNDKLPLFYYTINKDIKKERQIKKHSLTKLDNNGIIIKKDI